jgi:hypothetical protein
MALIKRPAYEPATAAWTGLTATLSIGPEHNISLNSALDDALLQSSLAQVFFIDRSFLRTECLDLMVSSEYQSIGDALLTLEASDPDTCSAALDTLHEIIQIKRPQGSVMQISLILLQIFHLVHKAHDAEILSKAQTVFAEGLCLPEMRPSVLRLVRKEDLVSTIDKLESQCLEGAPSNVQSALHLLGFFLDWVYQNHPKDRRTILANLARYIRILRMTIIDTNPFDARFAAVQSVAALQHIWTLRPVSKAEGPLLLGLTFVLYDMLNDDDDEIRNVAAVATSRLLSTHAKQGAVKPAVPILTSHHLARFMVTHFHTSPHLAKEATRRLTATTTTSFAQTFQETRKQDTALFTTEKQNLFQDPTLDALLWSRVLSSLPIASPQLATWVSDALTVLTHTAREEPDGALGWSAKAEVFTVGMRVLCAAGVVLKWEGGSSVAARDIGAKLVEFLVAARESEVHGLWVGKAERVLEGSVVDVLTGVHCTLVAVQRALWD